MAKGALEHREWKTALVCLQKARVYDEQVDAMEHGEQPRATNALACRQEGSRKTRTCRRVGTRGETTPDETRYALARSRARTFLSLSRQRPPVDVQAIIDRMGIPVVVRSLSGDVRGTIGDIAGKRSIILGRRFASENERRWVLAEELGHVVLNHQLVESTQPGTPAIGLLEERRIIYEREARAFAAELLMPLAEVRRQWFDALRDRFGPDHEASQEELIRRLAEQFGVSASAMRVRLTGLRLI